MIKKTLLSVLIANVISEPLVGCGANIDSLQGEGFTFDLNTSMF